MQKTVINLIKNSVAYNHVNGSDKKVYLSNRVTYNSQKRGTEQHQDEVNGK